MRAVAPRRLPPRSTMGRGFRRGDRVSWNSEAGRVSGVIVKKITSDTRLKGRVRHASRDNPQYVIRSDKTDHVAIHKAAALTKISAQGRHGAR
jgi:Hypervirulence associated proteins TUDOR domain